MDRKSLDGNKKPKDLKAAAHFLKQVALRRYREKVQLLCEAENSPKADKLAGVAQSSNETLQHNTIIDESTSLVSPAILSDSTDQDNALAQKPFKIRFNQESIVSNSEESDNEAFEDEALQHLVDGASYAYKLNTSQSASIKIDAGCKLPTCIGTETLLNIDTSLTESKKSTCKDYSEEMASTEDENETGTGNDNNEDASDCITGDLDGITSDVKPDQDNEHNITLQQDLSAEELNSGEKEDATVDSELQISLSGIEPDNTNEGTNGLQKDDESCRKIVSEEVFRNNEVDSDVNTKQSSLINEFEDSSLKKHHLESSATEEKFLEENYRAETKSSVGPSNEKSESINDTPISGQERDSDNMPPDVTEESEEIKEMEQSDQYEKVKVESNPECNGNVEKITSMETEDKHDTKQDGEKEDRQQKDENMINEEHFQENVEASPPVVESVLGEMLSDEPKQEEAGIADDFFYELEQYQSIPYVSDGSGLPKNMLQFFHSFGYDCRKRSNLHLLRGPTGLFAAGNLVHLLNLSTGEHQFLRSGSGGGIGALAVHPSGNYFAVAEKGIKPYLLVYEFPSLKLYRILRGGTDRAYSFIDFNPKGDLLASVGSAPDYMLTVWDWNNEKVMLRSKAFSQEVYRVTFSPEQEGQLTSCGTTHIRFWKMAWTFTGLKLKGEIGRFGKTSLGDIEGYIQLPDGKVLSGSDWGNMLLWDGGLIKVEICRKNLKPCHIGSIQQLVMDEGELITIGLDGYVRVWEMEAIDSADTTDESDVFEIEPMNELKVGTDVQLTCMVKADVRDDPTLEEGASIWYAQDANGGIWKLDLSFSHTTKPPEKLFSYTSGPITGISCSPVSHLVASTGDAYVRVYDYLSKTILCHYYSPTPHTTGTSLLWPNNIVDPKGTSVIAGFSDGVIRLLTLCQIDDTNELTLKQVMKPHSSSITAMAFDNTGELLATGSTDCTVFFFSVGHDRYEPLGFVKIPGEVTSMEWSPAGFPDTTLLVSCSNGKVVEIMAPSLSSIDTSHSYMLMDVPIKYFTFKSIKSQLRQDEERERKEIGKAKRRKQREKELKKRKDRGEEISDEDGQAFLDEDSLAEEEEEEEPLFIPPEPCSILQAFYLTPGRFAVSMDGYDAGYLYECAFPKGNEPSDPDTPIAPSRAVPVRDSNDIPVTSLAFTKDRRKFVSGFKNGLLRVYPLGGDPEAPFDLDLLSHHWNLNMHDNDTGHVIQLAESYDGAYMFSSGGDGNLFGYTSLTHEEIIKSMEGKRAKLPTPKKRFPDEQVVDDIDDPNAYCIEDAKLKAEHDKMIRDAEAKKMAERRRIMKLRKSFLELLHRNNDLPESVQLKHDEFELDPSLRKNMVAQTRERIERVRLEMRWDKEKLALAHEKVEKRFRSQLECDRIVVHACNSSHIIASYRVAKLAEEYHTLRETVEQRVRAASLVSEGGVTGLLDGNSFSSDRPQDDSAIVDDTTFLNETNKKKKSTILQGRQAEKVAKAIKKAEESKLKREKRQHEWEDLYKSKPDEHYEDPADVAAIREAQANMGDFKLKTGPDYVVPEHLRMDTEKKRYQILILQGLMHHVKSEFNEKLIALRNDKFKMIEELKQYVELLKNLQINMPKQKRVSIPSIPRPHADEEPHRKFEYTRESLLKFEEEEKQRQVEAAKKKRKGDGGLFGGFGDEDDPSVENEDQMSTRKTPSSIASSAMNKRGLHKMVSSNIAPPTMLELQLAEINKIRKRYQRDYYIRLIGEKMTSFDAELLLLRHSKQKLDVDLKMADLRQVTLLEELLLLKEYEKRETTLSRRVMSKRNELSEINGKAAEMQIKLEAKRRDIERLSDREKALYASFSASLGDNNKFADFLSKVFKKKIKRAKKKVIEEGGEEESDESSSDESDLSSDEDEDDSVEGGFDDSVCPPGCDQQLFESAIALREKRLDLEESLVEEKKVAETLKKDVDSLTKKAKVIESQLKTALADLEAFQVEKQGKLNELDVVVPLRLHQVEHVHNAAVPSDLAPCLVFANISLTSLQRRIKELQQEKSEQRKFYKEARQQHVHLIKNRRVMEEKIEKLEDKCEHMMMLKFGRIVDLEKLDSVTINKNVEELKEQVRRNEVNNAKELMKRQKHIDHLKEKITELTKENTRRLEGLNVLVNDKDNLERELDHRQSTMELEQPAKKKSEIREQHRLVQLVQLQAQEIQALKEEIGLLSRKGGHILPPAQPPLGQDPDVM